MKTVFTLSPSGSDATVRLHVKLPAAIRKQEWKDRRRIARQLTEDYSAFFLLKCDCNHCANDWDCCGRLVHSHFTYKLTKRGITFIQHASRNY